MNLPAEIRRTLRSRRKALTEAERVQAARWLATHLIKAFPVRRSRRIACYFPNDGEIGIDRAFPTLRAIGKHLYLPVIERGRLRFFPYDKGTPLGRNKYDIPEPALSLGSHCPPQALDLVLVPLVAFDARGNRLGMGAGYYDRCFAYLKTRQAFSRPPLVGVAYAFQEVAELPVNPWDVPLDGVVTERGWRYLGRRRVVRGTAEPP